MLQVFSSLSIISEENSLQFAIHTKDFILVPFQAGFYFFHKSLRFNNLKFTLKITLTDVTLIIENSNVFVFTRNSFIHAVENPAWFPCVNSIVTFIIEGAVSGKSRRDDGKRGFS